MSSSLPRSVADSVKETALACRLFIAVNTKTSNANLRCFYDLSEDHNKACKGNMPELSMGILKVRSTGGLPSNMSLINRGLSSKRIAGLSTAPIRTANASLKCIPIGVIGQRNGVLGIVEGV